VEIRLRRRTSGALAIAAVLVVLFLFVVPTVPYTLSFQIPYDFRPGVGAACNHVPQASQEACVESYLYPPVNVTGRASLSYASLGFGIPPFNSSYLITRGNDSALFQISGTKIASAENLGVPVSQIDPPNIIAIENASIARNQFSMVNFSVTVVNIGAKPIEHMLVTFDIPGKSTNFTQGGVTWVQDSGIGCSNGGYNCDVALAPGKSSTLSTVPLDQSPINTKSFEYRIRVTAEVSGSWFIYDKMFEGVWPATGITPDWIAAFIQDVNSNRTGQQLTEDQTLDAFAQTRFQTQVANYNVSNYGFQQDYAKAFPGSALQIGETTLWPGTQLPFEYASFLQESAPGHWSVLTDSSYTRFGYYIGYGPSIVVSQPCSVTEFPGNVNITALLASHGCQFHIEQAVWLVIEVGSCG
jgi:hypothetical protein